MKDELVSQEYLVTDSRETVNSTVTDMNTVTYIYYYLATFPI